MRQRARARVIAYAMPNNDRQVKAVRTATLGLMTAIVLYAIASILF